MFLPNVRRIAKTGSPINSLKMILAIAASSRPKYRSLFLGLLQPFAHNGEILWIDESFERKSKIALRTSDLQADSFSTLELCVIDIYEIERSFQPDLVIDGGGNIGLFTLRAAASVPPDRKTSVKLVICEPLPRNVIQIRKHLEMNHIDAELMPYCLGGSPRTVPFYCRAANESSFDPGMPFDKEIEIPVITLHDAIGSSSAERILIKLDIEGMEMEVLKAYLPEEKRAVYIVGELHHFPVNAANFERMFHDHGWIVELFGIGEEESNFRACSPAAVPLLKWPSSVKPYTPVGVS